MNRDIQNLLISEYLGIHNVKYDKRKWNSSGPETVGFVAIDEKECSCVYFYDETSGYQCDLDYIHPKNYAGSLDAMHEAEKHLHDNYTSQDFRIAKYTNHLENIISYRVRDVGWSFALTTATAAQKAEAFLKTIGKWKE